MTEPNLETLCNSAFSDQESKEELIITLAKEGFVIYDADKYCTEYYYKTHQGSTKIIFPDGLTKKHPGTYYFDVPREETQKFYSDLRYIIEKQNHADLAPKVAGVVTPFVFNFVTVPLVGFPLESFVTNKFDLSEPAYLAVSMTITLAASVVVALRTSIYVRYKENNKVSNLLNTFTENFEQYHQGRTDKPYDFKIFERALGET